MRRDNPFVLLDNARAVHGRLSLFRRAKGTIEAGAPEDVNAALDEIGKAVAAGYHVAGYFSYELGYALEAKLAPLMPRERDLPLLWFGIFGARDEFHDDEADAVLAEAATGRAYTGPLALTESEESYGAKFARAKDYIAAGDIYQVNLTFPARFRFVGDPLALYRRLRVRARAGHGAFIDDGKRQLLSLSPESFFTLGNSRLTARPMKGTAARGATPHEDARLKAWLQASEKDRAENLMIVDLIRNDMGRVARLGSVEVEELFAIETYPTVHQMVSTVRADVKQGTTPAGIVRALFPCGSVTGTPKIRAMEIIRELESEPRGVYCGAIGAFAPDGSADFNVAIRTLTIVGGEGRLNVGGAIVADSTASGEYEECLIKARYYTEGRRSISLIETLHHGQVFTREHLHLGRMAMSARQFAIAFDKAKAKQALATAVRGQDDASRVRLVLNEDGQFTSSSEALETVTAWTYAISQMRVRSGDALARHKTDWRELYGSELTSLRRATGCDEVIFLNERDELVEGSRTNIFVRLDARLVTPPLSSGALDGCLRREMLDAGTCAERVLTLADLARANAVYLGNSLRGLIEAWPAAL
jgi:para-aminobenzoate synthetase / 4-amino-4-deoxychorismate lyase